MNDEVKMPLYFASVEQFEQATSELGKDVMGAATHLRLLRDLEAAIPKYEYEFNQANCFWSLTLDAHLFTAIWFLQRVYDKDTSSLSLAIWLKATRLSNSKFPELQRFPATWEYEADLESITDSDPAVKELILFRNNHGAHRSAKLTMQQGVNQKPYELTHSVLDTLVQRAFDLLNKYRVLVTRASWAETMVGHDDFETVLKATRSWLKEREREYDS